MTNASVSLVERAMDGDAAAMREVLEVITPAIQSGVGRTVRRRLPPSLRSAAAHEVEDLTQDVLAAFFADNARRLLAYRADKGLSLHGYAELVASRLAISVLRSRRRSPFTAEPLPPEDLEHVMGKVASPEADFAQQQLRDAVIAGVVATLRPRGREIFRLLVVEEAPVEEVCARTGLRPNAVHAWRCRLRRTAQEVTRRILRDEAWGRC